MAELSIEEKAKAYDYAVNKAKELILNENGVVRVDKPLFDELFPSKMEESEDERIRQRIIHALHGDVLEMSEIKEAIAWLEKQNTPAKLSEEEQNRFAKGILTSCAMSFIDYLDAHKYEGKMCVSNGECEDIENAFHNAMWDKLHRYYGKYIVPVKKERKTKALFTLTMPKNNSWNGHWSGEGRCFCKELTAFRYGKAVYPLLKEGKYGYDFGDGWFANVKVTFVTPSEARSAMKKSDGFCGYEWMIDEICKLGEIRPLEET